MTDTPNHPERVKRLSVVVPRDIADEICELPTIGKATLLMETIDDLIEKLDEFPELLLSATTTQWVRSLNIREQLQLCENLSLMLMTEIKPCQQ
jgi:hypothetical protein